MTKRNRIPRAAWLIIGAGLLFSPAMANAVSTVSSTTSAPVVSEQFSQIDNWRPLEFPLATNSSYLVTSEGYLQADSNDSVSAIVLQQRFLPEETPILSWRWNVSNVHAKGNALSEDGDDFAMRVSVCFKFEPKKVSDNKRRWFNMEKLIWGEYPPYRVLHYVFANRTDLGQRHLPCPYSDRARIVVQRCGTDNLGQWHEERVNIMDDFRAAFGEEPPKEAVISVMADGDNTQGQTTAFLDWIEISQQDG